MKTGTSFSIPVVSNVQELVPSSNPIAYEVGAFAHGKLSVEYPEKRVSVSNYPFSAAFTCANLTTAFEEVWSLLTVGPCSETQRLMTLHCLPLPTHCWKMTFLHQDCGVSGSQGCTFAICLPYKHYSCKQTNKKHT